MVEVVGGGGAGSVLGRAAGGRCRRPPPPAAHTHLDDGRLAAARPPHQGHHLARCNGQVQAAQNGHGRAGGVGKVDAAEFQAAREVGRGDAAAARQPRLPQHQGHHLFGRPQGGRDDGIDVSQHPGVHVEHHLVEQEGREAADRQQHDHAELLAAVADHDHRQGVVGHRHRRCFQIEDLCGEDEADRDAIAIDVLAALHRADVVTPTREDLVDAGERKGVGLADDVDQQRPDHRHGDR